MMCCLAASTTEERILGEGRPSGGGRVSKLTLEVLLEVSFGSVWLLVSKIVIIGSLLSGTRADALTRGLDRRIFAEYSARGGRKSSSSLSMAVLLGALR